MRASATFTEPLLGWRVWGVKDVIREVDGVERTTPWLAGIGVNIHWPDQRPLEAICLRRDFPLRHSSPQPDCTCGAWALKGQERAETMLAHMSGQPGYASHHVVGRVSLWGRIIESEHGWRAQYAYPYELVCRDHALASRLRSAYRVDVVA